MSVHYSAIVSKGRLTLPDFEELVLSSGVYAYVATSPAQGRAWLDQMSSLPPDCCVLAYDDRIGLRESIVVLEGRRVAFGEQDELWVPIDEDGRPLKLAQPLLSTELEDEEEYATIKDAIQLGLDQFGISMTSQEFRGMITRSPVA